MSAFSQRAVAIGATAAFFGVLFGLAQSRAEPCPTQCASGKIPLGIAAPTSGQAVASAFGAQFVKPVEIAVRELNAAGGLMTFLILFFVAFGVAWPIAVRITEFLIRLRGYTVETAQSGGDRRTDHRPVARRAA